MFDYESGVLVSFIIWFLSAIYLIIRINSTHEKNLHKIGRRLSWITLTQKELNIEYVNKPIYKKVAKFIFIQALSFISIFLSWLYVVYFFGFTLFILYKKIDMPQSIRSCRWKLNNIDMSFDAIVKELVNSSVEQADYETFKEQIMKDMFARGLSIY